MPALSSAARRLWVGKPPFTVADYDDFIVWVTLGIVLGGRIGYVLFYNLPQFAAHPIEIFEVWKGGMSFHGGFGLRSRRHPLCLPPRHLDPVARRRDLRGGADRALFRPARKLRERRAVGAADRRAVGYDIPEGDRFPRHPSQLYEATLEGLVLFGFCSLSAIRMGALKRPGPDHWPVCDVLCSDAHRSASSSASPMCSSGSCGTRGSPWACCSPYRCSSPGWASPPWHCATQDTHDDQDTAALAAEVRALDRAARGRCRLRDFMSLCLTHPGTATT